MRVRGLLCIVLMLTLSGSGCVFRQQGSGRIDTRVTLVAIEDTLFEVVELVEDAYVGGLIGRETYADARKRIASVIKRYNILVRIRKNRKTIRQEDLVTVLDDLISIKDKFAKIWGAR